MVKLQRAAIIVSLLILLTEKLRLLSFFYPNNLLNSFLFDKFPDVYSLYTFMLLWWKWPNYVPDFIWMQRLFEHT